MPNFPAMRYLGSGYPDSKFSIHFSPIIKYILTNCRVLICTVIMSTAYSMGISPGYGKPCHIRLRRFSPAGGPIRHCRQYICRVLLDHCGSHDHLPFLSPDTHAVQWSLGDHVTMMDTAELLISNTTISNNQ